MDKNVILRDFNISIKENHTRCFYDNYALKKVNQKPTCYKNSENYLYRFNAHNCAVQFSKHISDRNKFV